MAPAFPWIESPIRIGAVPVRNRILYAAVVTFLPDQGRVSDRLLRFYENRARGGAGLIISEPVSMVRRQDVPNWVRAWTDEACDGLRAWASAVESHDCRLIAQLVDRGRGRNTPGRNADAIGPSALPDDLSFTMPRALAGDEIRDLIDEFSRSAARLQACGFSGVEISAGHGHLFHQFLSPRMNRRTDEYGGDLAGRTRLLRELIRAIRRRCGEAFLVAVKLPGDDGLDGSIDEEEAGRIAQAVTADQAIDLVSFAQGSHSHTLERHVPDDHAPRLPYLPQLRRLRPHVRGARVAALGRITDPAEAEGILSRGDADLIALARALIADPAWPNKAFAGRSGDIRYCVSCNTCWDRTTAQRQPIGCDNNPFIGTADEVDGRPRAAPTLRRVVVVGAGIAGMEAAWTAAARGHAVTVLAAGSEIGGKARLRAGLPGGESRSSIYDFQQLQASRFGVRILFGIQADVAAVRRLEPDVVILATGATMVPPLWLPDDLRDSGAVMDLRRTMAALARITRRQPGSAVLYDMDHTEGTYAAAERLHQLFEEVVLVTPRESIARDTPLVTRQGILRRLSLLGTRLVTLSEIRCRDIENGSIDCVQIHTGATVRIAEPALLAYATPRAPDDGLLDGLRSAGIPTHCIGDCRNARDTYAATAEGHAIAMTI